MFSRSAPVWRAAVIRRVREHVGKRKLYWTSTAIGVVTIWASFSYAQTCETCIGPAAGAVTQQATALDSAGTTIEGTTGNDVLINSDAVDSVVEFDYTNPDQSVTVIGPVVDDQTVSLSGESTGIDGLAGNDSLTALNGQDFDVRATVTDTLGSLGVDVTDQGTSATDVLLGATALGLSGGPGRDNLTNRAAMNVTAETVVGSPLTGVPPTNFFGDAGKIAARIRAQSEAVGLDGGTGADVMFNFDSVAAMADATTDQSTILRGDLLWTNADTTLETFAKAVAARGDGGKDQITNLGTMSANANALTIKNSRPALLLPPVVSQLSDFGDGDYSTAVAVGIEGGAGSDTLKNGDADNAALAELDVSAVANTIALKAEFSPISYDPLFSAGLILPPGAQAQAFGMHATSPPDSSPDRFGDVLENYGGMTVDAASTSIAASIGFALVGNANVNAMTSAEALAAGMYGGGGQDSFLNAGAMEISADATSSATSVFGTVSLLPIPVLLSNANTAAEARAVGLGIYGDDGNDDLGNSGDINVNGAASTVGVSVEFELGIDTSPSDGGGGSGGGDGGSGGGGSGGGGTDGGGSGGGGGTDGGSGGGTDGGSSGTTGGKSGESSHAETAFEFLWDKLLKGTEAITDNSLDAPTKSTAVVTGLHGGAGDDVLENMASGAAVGSITVLSEATTTNVQVSASVSMPDPSDILLPDSASDIDASSESLAVAQGMAGGEGQDRIDNQCTVDVTARAKSNAVGVSLSTSVAVPIPFLGTGADMSSEATAKAWGLNGGNGDSVPGEYDATYIEDSTDPSLNYWEVTPAPSDDTITNSGTVSVLAEATANSVYVDLLLAGSSLGRSDSTANATSFGADGGLGSDYLENTGTISATANAYQNDTKVLISGIGAALGLDPDDGGNNTGAIAQSFGMAGGPGEDELTPTGLFRVQSYEDDDTIINSGDVTATATADADAGTVDITLAGAALGIVRTGASAEATGLYGGAGADYIRNDGSVTADATATTSGTNFALTLEGASIGKVNLNSAATAVGLDGGGGDDQLLNFGQTVVDSEATFGSRLNTSLVYTAGASIANATVRGDALSIGMSGGAGDDFIYNGDGAAISVNAHSNATFDRSFSYTGNGFAGNKLDLGSTARAYGLSGGDGADQIENWADLNVTSTADLAISSRSITINGKAGYDAKTSALAESFGIMGGDAGDVILNFGDVDVSAESDTNADTVAITIGAGVSRQASQVDSRVNAIGIIARGPDSVENGDNTILNDTGANISVTAIARASASGGAKTIIVGGAEGSSSINATMTAYGITADTANDFIENRGDVSVTQVSRVSSRNTADGGFLFGGTGAEARAEATAFARGINLSEGDDTFVNSGNLDVQFSTAEPFPTGGIIGPSMTVNSYADGARLINGDARSTVSGRMNSEQIGVLGGAGVKQVFNSGQITVRNSPWVVANAHSNGNGVDGDGRGTASVELGFGGGSIAAYGVLLGDGGALVVNDGLIDVISASSASASADIDGDFGGDAVANATATLRATATGIQTGQGDDTIHNSGTIEVYAGATVTASAIANAGVGGSAAETAGAHAYASAWGINTGAGDDYVGNSGTIVVNAYTNATAGTSVDNNGNPTGSVSTTNSRSATAVLTGDGWDTVENFGAGIIDARIVSISGLGQAINTGNGNDWVRLIDQSAVYGGIDLGLGDDLISFAGTSLLDGDIDGGAGNDTLWIEDRRQLSLAASRIGSIETLDVASGDLTISTGTLVPYLIPSEGEVRTELYGDGNGSLNVDGSLAIGPNATLTVEAMPNESHVYSDGDVYTVVTADRIFSDFSEADLPDTRFISSALVRETDSYSVELSVEPFKNWGQYPVQADLGGYLDEVSGAASGDMALLLSEIQTLTDDGDIARAYETLGPSAHLEATEIARLPVDAFGEILMRRLGEARNPGTNPSVGRTNGTSFLSLVPSPSRELDVTGPGGGWVESGVYVTSNEGGDGFAGYEAVSGAVTAGTQFAPTDNAVYGASLGVAGTGYSLKDGTADGNILSWSIAGYGSLDYDNAWVDGTLTFASQSIDQNRLVDVGTLTGVANSERNAAQLAAKVEVGKSLELVDGIDLWPTVGLTYDYLHESAYTETGAGAANLTVDSRQTEALVSRAGLYLGKTSRKDDKQSTVWTSAKWSHNFEIDDGTLVSGLTGAPGTSFATGAPEVDSDWVDLELGYRHKTKDGQLRLVYGTELGKSRPSHSIALEMKFRF